MEKQAKSVDQYKQEMLAQARRNNVQTQATIPAAQTQAKVVVVAPAPAHEKVTPAEHVERILEKAEHVAQEVEPIAEIALRSGLSSAGVAVVAKGLELGMEALEDRIERRREERRAEQTPPPAPPAPVVDVDIDFSPQIVQTAPVVVAPTVTAPAVAAQTTVAPNIVAPAAEVVTVAAPPPAPVPPVPLPAPPPVTEPVPSPAPVPLPPPPVPAWPPITPPPLPPPMVVPPVPVAVPTRPSPVECETVTCTVSRRPAPRPPAKPCCPVHNPCRQSCCTPRRPASCSPIPKPPASRPCSCKNPRNSPAPRAESASWFMQPAVEAAYAAYTAGLEPQDTGDDAVFAYGTPGAVPAASLSDVAFIGQLPAPQAQDGYFELPTQDYASLEDFLARNTARGTLELQVRVASDDAAPVEGANVDVMQTIAGVTYLFFHGVTDTTGSTGRIALPAPDRGLSFSPPHGFVPYAVYTVSVTHGEYAPQVFENVTVFPDTEAIQVVRLGAAPFVVDEGRYVM